MKKISPFYYFFFLLGLIVMIGASSLIVTGLPDYVYIIVIAFVVLLVLVITSVKLSDGTLEHRTTLYKECIKCKQEIEIDSEYCNHCGTVQENTITCEFCGGECHQDEETCPYCNALLK